MSDERRIIKIKRRLRKVNPPAFDARRHPFYARLGRKIKEARYILMLTQDELAQKVKMSRGSIANIETGRQQMLLHQLKEFAKALKLDARDLLP